MTFSTVSTLKNILSQSVANLIGLTKFIAIIAAFLVFLPAANADTKPAEKKFTADLRAAFDAKDVSQFLNLVCWDNVSPDLKEELKAQYSMLVAQPVAKIELIGPTPAKKQPKDASGVVYKPNLTVTKNLKITFNVKDPAYKIADPKSLSTYQMPVGEKDGKFLLTTSVNAR